MAPGSFVAAQRFRLEGIGEDSALQDRPAAMRWATAMYGATRLGRAEDRVLNPGDPELIEAIDAHIAQHIAPVDMVFHEIISPDLHIDVHWVRPDRDRPFHTLVTSGMSERPMSTGEEAVEFRFAELAILLEPNWPIEHSKFGDENVYWPIRLLKTVARFPFEVGTWVST